MTHNPCLLDYLDKKHSRRVKKFSTGQKIIISVQRTRKKNCGPREGFVKVFLATLFSVNDVIKPAKCVGLGPRTTNAFTRAFDSYKIMVIEMFRALNKLMFFEISEY